jgi:hypothetical protein
LDNSNSLIDSSILFLAAIKFVLVDQHADCFLLSDMLELYTIIELHVKKGWDKCPKNERISISPSGKRNNWKSGVRRKIYLWQRSFDGLLMPIWLGMTQRITVRQSRTRLRGPHPIPKRKTCFIPTAKALSLPITRGIERRGKRVKEEPHSR